MFAAKSITGALAAVLLTTAVATPAEAQRYRRHHRGGNGISLGDVALGTIAVVGVATVIGALGDGRRSQRRYEGRPYDDRPYGRGYDRGVYGDGGYDDGRYANGRYDGSRYGGVSYGDGRQASVEACAYEAEQEVGQKFGGRAQVREIGNVERSRDGYRVRGTVEVQGDGRSYGAQRFERVQFSCSARGDRVVDLDVGSYYARR